MRALLVPALTLATLASTADAGRRLPAPYQIVSPRRWSKFAAQLAEVQRSLAPLTITRAQLRARRDDLTLPFHLRAASVVAAKRAALPVRIATLARYAPALERRRGAYVPGDLPTDVRMQREDISNTVAGGGRRFLEVAQEIDDMLDYAQEEGSRALATHARADARELARAALAHLPAFRAQVELSDRGEYLHGYTNLHYFRTGTARLARAAAILERLAAD